MQVSDDVARNTAAIGAAIRRAAAEGADILLTPEGSLSGYTPHFDRAEVTDGVREVTALARELRVGLALGTCFTEADDSTYNQLRFYSPRRLPRLPQQDPALRHDGRAACGGDRRLRLGDLRTFEFAGIRVGGLICNDLWANPGCTPMPDPHLTQQLARMGARVIFHAVNGGRDGSEWSRGGLALPRGQPAHARRRRAACGSSPWTTAAPHPMSRAPRQRRDRPAGNWACRTDPQGEQFFTHTIEVGQVPRQGL